jgi:dienelactone hydrolase
LAVAALATITTPAARSADARPGPAAFFQNPSMTGVSISPDGRTLAVTLASTPNERVRLISMDVKSLQPTVLAQFAGADVHEVHWINDHRIVFDLDDRQVSQGEAHAASGLYAINADGSYFRQLVSQHWPNFIHKSTDIELLPWYTRYLGSAGTGHDPDEVYVAEPARRDGSGASDLRLRLLNTVTRRVKDIETPTGAERWVFDPAGEPRAMVSLHDGRGQVMVSAAGRWTTVADFDVFVSTDEIWPEQVDDGDRLFVTAAQGHDTRSLYTYDLATRKLSDKPFLQSDHFDLAPRFITQRGKVVGIRYRIDAEVTKWLDPGLAALQDRVDALLPSTINRLSIADKGDGHVVVVQAYSDRVPGLFFLFDTVEGRLVALGSSHPEVDPDRMSGMEPVHYPARDGLRIPAWLTVPQGVDRKNLPLVVLVHGDPYVRGEYWAWNPEVQFLAARGYVVLEPEYRGSTGYGAALFKAGWKQWGRGMQDDLADGVKWAVDQGLVDPKRVCIAGSSYGGYAALMGLVNDPQLYRCGIDWVGVTDIDLLYSVDWSDLSDTWKRYGLPKLVGDRVADAAQLKATSPIRNAAKIHAPLLLAYGGKDKRVPLIHGEAFRQALMEQPGADLQWVVYDQEGHGWHTLATRLDFWSRVSTFLDRNLASK